MSVFNNQMRKAFRLFFISTIYISTVICGTNLETNYQIMKLPPSSSVDVNEFDPNIQSILLNPMVKEVEYADIESSESYRFSGLAKFYNKLDYFRYNMGRLTQVFPIDSVLIDSHNCLVISGRFYVWFLIVSKPGLSQIQLYPGALLDDDIAMCNVFRIDKNKLINVSHEMARIRFDHLWDWLAKMSLGVEWLFISIQAFTKASWGLTIILLSLLTGLITMPLGQIRKKWQARVDSIQAQIEPSIKSIKIKYDGQDAHERIMAVYKEYNISPLFTVKPLLVPFAQAPIFIAVFAALGEMEQLNGAKFLWINNLSYPDAIATIPFSIPLLGDKLNLMPYIMSFVTVLSAMIYKNPVASLDSLKKQRYNIYYLAVGFFMLFYPFPAALIIFWTGINTFQMIQYFKTSVN
jgi:YidC/Oxa1 family membrane protein insertase